MVRVGLLAPGRRYEDAFARDSQALFQASGSNLGNFAFIEALWRHLGPGVTLLPWHVSPAEARESCDILVLAAANQLGGHNDLGDFATHLERIGLPLVVIGLGAQAATQESEVELPAGTERWARVLAALAPNDAPNIGVRGEFTRRTLEGLGLGDRAVTMGCPSNFLNDRPDFYDVLARRTAKGRIDRLCLAAGSRHFPGTRETERRLAGFVAATGGAYVVQADLDMVRFARGEPCELEAIRAFVAPDLDEAAFALWRQRHAACFIDATSWAEAMRGFDFAVGARFHGVMMALQAGVPGGLWVGHRGLVSRGLETVCWMEQICNRRKAGPARSGMQCGRRIPGPVDSSRGEQMRGVFLSLVLAMSSSAWAQTPAAGSREAGHFQVTLECALLPVPMNKIHSWTLSVMNAAGAPVDGTTFAIDARAPIIDRIMPTAPRVTRALGSGRYLIEGMKFDMAGRWRLQVSIQAGADSDRFVQNVDVK